MEALTKAGAKYLHCLIDPWHAEPSHVLGGFCYPSNIRVCKKVNYGYTVNGFGYVGIKPQYMVTNDVNSIFYTNASSTATTVADSTTTVAYDVMSSPYASTDYSATGRQVRIVAAGVKVTFRGRNDDIGGSVVGMRSIKGDTLAGLSYSDMNAAENTVTTDFTDKEYAVVFVPNSDLHLQWWDTLSDTENWFQGISLAILIQTGQQTTNIPFMIETVIVFECAGIKEKNCIVRNADRIQWERVINMCSVSMSWIGNVSTYRLNIGDEEDEKTAREFGADVEQEIPLFYTMSKGDDIELKNEGGGTITTLKGDGSNAVMSKGKIVRGNKNKPEQDHMSVPTVKDMLKGQATASSRRVKSLEKRKSYPNKRKRMNDVLDYVSDGGASSSYYSGASDYYTEDEDDNESVFSQALSDVSDISGYSDVDDGEYKSRSRSGGKNRKVKFKDAYETGKDTFELGRDLWSGDYKGALKDLKDINRSKLGKIAKKEGIKMLKKKGVPLLKKGGKALMKKYL